ncbi:RcsF protein [Idiomarina zobellii]|nr:RcsF protein [Idiomarina zobellii]
MRFPLFIALPLLTLTGCSILPGGSSSPMNWSSHSADIYRQGNLPSSNYEVISVVNGESCQREYKAAPASESDALKALRADAARFEADAVIETQCFNLKPDADSICYSEVSCVGRAIQWVD